MQRLEFNSADGVRLAREMWEILRRKKGCTLHRMYHSAEHDARWLAYSEWNSLAELAGARRESARSALNRRLHSMLTASSERAFEPFGPVRSTHGINFASEPVAVLIDFAAELEEAQAALGFAAQAPGYLSHLLMHEVGKPQTVVCLAHFDSADNARAFAASLGEQAPLRELGPHAELFVA